MKVDRHRRRRRPGRHRRQPLDPRGPPQRRPDGDLRQQLQLRDDRRAGLAHDAGRSKTATTPYTQRRGAFRPLPPRHRRRGPVRGALGAGVSHETVVTLEKAIKKQGFSFVELLEPCPTGFGKENRLREATEVWNWYRENSVPMRELREMSAEGRAANEKVVVGTLWDEERPEYVTRWKALLEEKLRPARRTGRPARRSLGRRREACPPEPWAEAGKPARRRHGKRY
jgi:hypothetical protein